MKIAMIGQKGMPAHYGGVERHVHDLSVRLVRAGHDVTAYSRKWYSPDMLDTVEGVRIVRTPTLRTKHFDAITHTLTSTIHAIMHKFDVIHYHGVGPALLSWIPRVFAPKTKVVTTFHSIDRYHQKWNLFVKWFLKLGERAACRFAHETISVSLSLQQYCRNEYICETTYIPNGVIVTPAPTATDKLEQFGLSKDNYLVMVSRLVAHKGAHVLVEAFRRFKQAHVNDARIANMKLAIVGGSVYTNDYVKTLHEQASVCNDIVFTDFQSGDTLEQLFAHATALVHPSFNEGLPINVIEAMSFEKPVLVSNIPEHLELITDPRCVFAENDVMALIECLYEFMNLGDTDKHQIAHANKQRVLQEYNWDVIVEDVIGVYKKQVTETTEHDPIPVV